MLVKLLEMLLVSGDLLLQLLQLLHLLLFHVVILARILSLGKGIAASSPRQHIESRADNRYEQRK